MKPSKRKQRARQDPTLTDSGLIEQPDTQLGPNDSSADKSDPTDELIADHAGPPLIDEDVTGHTESKSKASSSPRTLSICLYTDSPESNPSVIEKLEASGHTVDHFSDTDAALEALAANEYDLLFAGQSNASGLECMYFIKSFCASKKPKNTKFPIIVLTSDTSSKNIKSLTHAGANLVIAKHIDGKLNSNIFEVTQIVSKMPKSNSSTTSAKISKPNNRAAVKNSAKSQRQTSQAAVEKPAKQTSLRVLTGGGDDNQNSAATPAANEPRPEDKPAWRFPLSGLNRRMTIIAVGLIAAVTSGFAVWQGTSTRIPVEVVIAQQGVLMKSINAPGRIITRKQVQLSSSTPGQVAAILVEEGSHVNKGDVLAKLDNREAEITVKRAQAELAHIKSDVNLKARSLAQLKRTSNSGSVTSVLVKDLEAGLASAKARQRIAEEELSAVELALERLKIVAPFDAVVLEIYAVEGIWAEPSLPMFKLIDPSRFEAAIRVSGEDARDIDVGQPVIMSGSTMPDDWTGQVVRVAFDDNDMAQNNETLVYASLGLEAPALRYGQPVDTRIVTETSGDAIKLPFETVFEQDGRTLVALVENDKIKFQPVELGIQDLADIEIVNGLNPGQSVILPGAELEPGAKVTVSVVNNNETEEESGFPYREKYANVVVVTTEQLRKSFDDSIIVDTRSNFEFDVVHVNNAVNIPLASEQFLTRLENLRAKNDSKPIIFYCNGHTCTKSYKAAQKATEAGFKSVYAYDSGIFDWLRANRDHTTLLDASPAPLSKLVSVEYFKSRLLDFQQFQIKAAAKDTLVIDIRDEFQKSTQLALPSEALPLDQLLAKLNAGEYKDKQLLIFDAVGKQVRWLQYVLKDKGYKNYYFLRNGIAGATG